MIIAILTGLVLSAVQAATGLLIFGWSTAILIAIVQSIWSDDE